MKTIDKKFLRSKIILSVLTAGVMSTCIMGSAWAEEYENKVVVDNETKSFNDLVISNDIFDSTDNRVYSLYAKGSVIELNGDASISAEENNSSGGNGATAIRLQEKTHFTVNDNLTVNSTANNGKFAVGILTYGNTINDFYGTVTINAINNNLQKKNNNNYDGWQAARAMGLDLESGAITNFYDDVKIKAEGYSFNQAIYSYQASTVFHGDAIIEANSSRANEYGGDVRVINLEGDPPDAYDTAIEFRGDNTVIKGSGNGVIGIYSSGGPDKIFTKFTGKQVDVITEGNEYSYAVLSQYSGKLYSSATTNMNITANSQNGEAIAVFADEYAGSGGIVEILGNTNIIANGATASLAVLSVDDSDVTLGSTGKTVSLTGDVLAVNGTITLQGSDNTVNGIITSTNSGKINLTGENATYNVQHMVADGGTITVGEGTTIAVDSANITGDDYLVTVSNSGTLDVAKNSKIRILNAEKGQTFNIVDGSSEEAWAVANISADNFMLQYEKKADSDDYIITTTVADAKEVFGSSVIIPDVLTQTLTKGQKGDVAYDFFNSAVSGATLTKEAAARNINNAASMSELAGVSHGTYSASNILTDAVAEHMSLANGLDHDTDIWAHYVHNKENIDGLATGNSGARYDAQYNGIVVGADLYKHGKGTIGAALTYIDGKISGSTRNDAEYYGISIYGGIENEDSAIIGDISYLHGKNEITQNNSGYTLTGEPKSDALSVGVRAEQSFKAGAGKVVPYAGLRYMHLGTGDYTNSIGLSYDADDANLFLLPVGVKYSVEHKTAGWTLRPIVEVGYVWAMGDRDGQQTVSLNGTSNGFGYDVTDSGSYIGRFVLEAEKANVTYGLGYEYQKGDSVKANKWMVNLNWAF